MPSLILASQSPRRKELLQHAGLSFTSQKSWAPEIIENGFDPAKVVEDLALKKAKDVFSFQPDHVVIGADTIVSSDNQILGKPSTKAEARFMLQSLSGRSHHVYTGTAILSPKKRRLFHVKTEVRFYPLEDWFLEAYLSTSEPYDKAGAYGIQEKGRLFVESLTGDYFNVVGLPISRVMRELQAFDVFPSFSSN
ncbi:septum formation inhibitor Maf [Salibacterium salarium]|uniref:dTTP/UTP pyrophosphatase n=1 Tax=Salibacterium salarium TaxID=284579 RepID=A0A3R9Q2M6_9BACI|nr:Maf family protein [Salibacterium salarium]RSL32271.1 septum formation inhibitor Maf [Salibacterium salarium]